MKKNSANEIIVRDLDIDSVRNKVKYLEDEINRNLDIILLSNTKPDNSFLSAQFTLKQYGYI